MQALSRWLLSMLLLATVGCASGDLGIIVSVEGWPVEALSMRVRTSLDGTPRDVLQIPSGQSRFVIRLAPGETGQLTLDATALDRGGCKVATAQLAVVLGPGLHPTQEARLQLDRLPSILCTLTVDFTEGAGSVLSDPAGIQCERAGLCAFDFPSGTPVELLPSFDAQKQYVIWHGDCAGAADCSFSMDRSQHVELAFPPRVCTPDGFCWQHPLPQGGLLARVWVDPDGAAWSVGTNGTLLKCRGKSCTRIASNTERIFYGMLGRSADEVWAVGVDGIVRKCGGNSCVSIASGTTNTLGAVWGNRSGPVWVGGDAGTVVRCDADTCALLPAVTPSFLLSVGGSDSGEVWAVGGSGSVVKCSGLSCALVPSGTSARLTSVWVSSDGTAWVVGDGGTILKCRDAACSAIPSGGTDFFIGVVGTSSGEVFVHGVGGALLRCTGTTCSPLATGTRSLISKVWIAPSGEIWAAGDSGEILTCADNTCSTLWSGRLISLNWIAGNDTGTVWAVGDQGELVRCSDRKCLLISVGEAAALAAIAGSAAGEVWAGGTRLIRCSRGACRTIPRKIDTVIARIREANGEFWVAGSASTLLHCSGSSCIELDGSGGSSYTDIFASSSGQTYIVGANRRVKICKNTNCFTRDVVSPMSAAAGNTKELWAAGGNGYVYKLDIEADQSSSVASGTADDLSSLWMSPSGEVWAVGGRSIVKCSGSTCVPLPFVGTDDLLSVAGNNGGEIWAVGNSRNVIKCVGTSCMLLLVSSVPGNFLAAVKVDGQGTAWSVGSAGVVRRCSDTACVGANLGSSLTLRDLWISGTGDVWVAGEDGAILRYTPKK